jgi:hypothetical protein
MKNKFIKPEIEILAFHCENPGPDRYTRILSTEKSEKVIDLPEGDPAHGGVKANGGDLGVPYQW